MTSNGNQYNSPQYGASFAPPVGGMQQQQQQSGFPGQPQQSPSLAPSFNPYQSMQGAPPQAPASRWPAVKPVLKNASKPPPGVLNNSSSNSVMARISTSGWAGIGLFFERGKEKEHPVVVEVISGGSSAREVPSHLPSYHRPPRPRPSAHGRGASIPTARCTDPPPPLCAPLPSCDSSRVSARTTPAACHTPRAPAVTTPSCGACGVDAMRHLPGRTPP